MLYWVMNLGFAGGGGVADPGPARRRRMKAALATGAWRNLGYLLILIAPLLF